MILRESLIAVSLALAFVTQAWAECCNHCGCDCGCRKVCHLKCDVKKVTKIEYSCECEDFCVPCRSEKIGYECNDCCDGECKLFRCCEKPIYKPTGAVVHTKKKLIKHEVTKEEPVYKWVVETVCDGCAHRCLTCENGKSRAQVEAEAIASHNQSSGSLAPMGPPTPAPEIAKTSWWAAQNAKRSRTQ